VAGSGVCAAERPFAYHRANTIHESFQAAESPLCHKSQCRLELIDSQESGSARLHLLENLLGVSLLKGLGEETAPFAELNKVKAVNAFGTMCGVTIFISIFAAVFWSAASTSCSEDLFEAQLWLSCRRPAPGRGQAPGWSCRHQLTRQHHALGGSSENEERQQR
jgi:hypothetical protein